MLRRYPWVCTRWVKEDRVTRAGRWMVLTGIALLAGGCARRPGETRVPSGAGPVSKIELMVPCGQLGPFSEVAKLFEQANPGLKLEWGSENMVTITKQILDGRARPDVFLSMGDLEMNQLQQAGLLAEGTRTKYAENSLALMVPVKNPGGVQTIADLAKPSVEIITIPDPEQNSVGKHALEALHQAGLWDKVEKKIVIARFAADGKEVAAKGQAEATIAYYPCAVEVHVEGQPPVVPKDLKLVGPLSPDLYEEFSCEGAVLKGAENPEGGRKLLEFLASPQSQEIFRKWSFVREAPKAGTG